MHAPEGEVREIQWHCVSPQEQNHQMCRYCQCRATHMRKQRIGRSKKPMWVALCAEHARVDENENRNP